MLVSSAPFYVFLLAACLLVWLAAPSRWLRILLLAAANLFFLARFSLIYLALPVAAAIDFFIGLGLASAKNWAARRALVWLSVFLNVSLMMTLKLIPFFGLRLGWLLPLSLSFYCFQSLSYTIEIYLGELKPVRNFLHYLAAAFFFPSMTAGPIPRQGNLLGQLARPFSLDSVRGARALLLISTGLVKKLLIADYLSNNLVSRVFDTPALYSSAEILIAIYGYALQLFFDFSGYTDIARGAALLLGIDLPENFKRPYLSQNIADFWRRWHITFSEWLRDYLFDFFPKSRKRPVLSYSYAFFLTMILGGLWHGLSWNFAIWGALHGAALGVVFAWKRNREQRKRKIGAAPVPSPNPFARLAAGLLTFHFVCFTWIFFRAPNLDTAFALLRGLGLHTFSIGNITPLVAAVLVIAAIAHCLPPDWFDRIALVAAHAPFWIQGAAVAALILVIQTLAGRGSAPFVYGNF